MANPIYQIGNGEYFWIADVQTQILSSELRGHKNYTSKGNSWRVAIGNCTDGWLISSSHLTLPLFSPSLAISQFIRLTKYHHNDFHNEASISIHLSKIRTQQNVWSNVSSYIFHEFKNWKKSWSSERINVNLRHSQISEQLRNYSWVSVMKIG